ncbi:MAG TPA: SDR family oxidoreductase [Acidobacteriota bacterium]|nr:SDR family oxidoreductase [Acidobacteriota bacterium]
MPRMTFKRALVTGASAGLGAEYARELAAAGTELILAARRQDRLEELAQGLRTGHDVKVDVVPADLATGEGVGRLETLLAGEDSLDLLVNNAGYGGRTGFNRGEIAAHIDMLRVHVDAAVRLTKAALPGMIARGRGAVINVASVAAFSPFSGAMYSGTKSFLVMFSENLQGELRGKGLPIRVQALCPGLTHTEFHAASGQDLSTVPGMFWRSAGFVVRTSLRRLGGRVVCIPGWENKAVAFLMRCPLTAALVRAAGRTRIVRKKSGDKAD